MSTVKIILEASYTTKWQITLVHLAWNTNVIKSKKTTSGGSQEGQYIIFVTKIKIWSALLLTDHGYNPKG